MLCEGLFGHRGRRLLTRTLVVGATLLVGGCGRPAPVGGDQRTVVVEPIKIDDVHISAVDSGITVQYRTATSTRDCGAQAAEMPRVWDLVVKARLQGSAAQRVILFPEDTSGQSVSIEFTKNPSGQWSSAGPCSIRIPAG
jgi:hypothetical protein